MSRLTIIGLTGKKFHGKDTAATIIHKHSKSRVVRLSFAKPIKQALSFIHVIPMDYFDDPDLKEKPLPDWDNKTPRQLAQWLGTDIYRDMFDTNVWIKNMELRINKYLSSEMDTVIIITDTRFDNEAEFIRSIGGSIWSIDRNNPVIKTDVKKRKLNTEMDEHSSENGVSDHLIDKIFDNNGTIDELESQLIPFCEN